MQEQLHAMLAHLSAELAHPPLCALFVKLVMILWEQTVLRDVEMVIDRIKNNAMMEIQ